MSMASLVATAAKALDVLLTDTCTVTAPGAEVADAYGGTTPGTPTTVAGIPCRVDAPTGADQTVADRLGVLITAVVSLKRGAAVTVNDTIAVGGTGNVYDVTFVNDDESNRTMVRCGCKRVTT